MPNEHLQRVIREVREIYPADHQPDGYPAVRLRDMTVLVDEIERLTALLNRNLVMVNGRVYDHRDIVRMREQLAKRITDSWPDPNGGCPVCGGPTETDREVPPNPYVCEDCKNDRAD